MRRSRDHNVEVLVCDFTGSSARGRHEQRAPEEVGSAKGAEHYVVGALGRGGFQAAGGQGRREAVGCIAAELDVARGVDDLREGGFRCFDNQEPLSDSRVLFDPRPARWKGNRKQGGEERPLPAACFDGGQTRTTREADDVATWRRGRTMS